MKPIHTTLLISTVTLFVFTGAAQAGSDKLARIMGFGGVCSDCDLSKKDLSGAKLSGASFPRSNFTGTDLSNVEMHGSNFSRAVFRSTDFSGAEIVGSNFSRADFSGASLNEMEAQSANMSHANFNAAKGREAEFSNSNFGHSQMLGVTLREASFDACNFGHADLSGAKLRNSQFENSNLSNTTLDHADLREVRFVHVNFHNANFGNAQLKDVRFEEAYLAGADLSKVQNLTADQLEGACMDEKTHLPRKLSAPSCDEVSWADDFTGYNGSGPRTFSFQMDDVNVDLDEEDMRQIQLDVSEAMREGRDRLRLAGIALAEAFDEADFENMDFDWDFDSDHSDSSERRASRARMSRTTRSLNKAIRLLAEMELHSDTAQAEIDQAVASLERAQSILDDAREEQELAGK